VEDVGSLASTTLHCPMAPRASTSGIGTTAPMDGTTGLTSCSLFRGQSHSVRCGATTTSTFQKTNTHCATGYTVAGTTLTSTLPTTEFDKDLLEASLDSMASMRAPLLHQFRLEGPVRWRNGSRGAVQYARSINTGDEVAIKFYTDATAFECEEAAYMLEPLRALMPAVLLMVPNRGVRTLPSYSDR
jgi:hypothetical protein